MKYISHYSYQISLNCKKKKLIKLQRSSFVASNNNNKEGKGTGGARVVKKLKFIQKMTYGPFSNFRIWSFKI